MWKWLQLMSGRSKSWHPAFSSIMVRSSLSTSHRGAPSLGVGVLAQKLTESTALWRHAPDETKNTSTRELLQGDRCRLVVVGIETGDRWSTEAPTRSFRPRSICKAQMDHRPDLVDLFQV